MVKCSECGFLAVHNMKTGTLGEADDMTRQVGVIPRYFIEEIRKVPLEDRTVYQNPLCFLRKRDIRKDAREMEKHIELPYPWNKLEGTKQKEALKATLHQEISCRSHTQWHQGFTPK